MARGGYRGRFLKNQMSTGASSIEFEKKNSLLSSSYQPTHIMVLD